MEHRWPFFTPLLFHPHGGNLAYHANALVDTLPGALLALVLPLPVVFNLLVLANLVLAAWAMHGLARTVLRRAAGGATVRGARVGAAFAAVAYAGSPFHMAHLGHLNIFSIWVLPFLGWMLLRAREDPTSRRAALAGAAFGLCGLADGYHLLAALLFAPVLWLCSPGAKRPGLRAWAAMAGTALFLLLPVVVPMLQYGTRGFEDVRAQGANDYVADVLSYVLPSPLHPLWGAALRPAYAHLSGNLAENVVFPTFTVWVLALLAWRRRSRAPREERVWGIVALVFVVLSFGPYLHVGGASGIEVSSARRSHLRLPLPKLLLDALPLVSGARAAGRFASVGQLGFVMLALLGMYRTAPAGAGRNPKAAGLGISPRTAWLATVLVAFECLAVPLPTTSIEIPPAYHVLHEDARRAGRAGALLEIPPVHAGDKVYQLYQTVHGLPLLGGRLARGPRRGYDHLHRDPFLARLFDTDPLKLYDGLLSLDGLDSLGVRWVMLHDDFDPRMAAIARVLAARYETLPTPPGPEHLLRRRAGADAGVPRAEAGTTAPRASGALPPHADPSAASARPAATTPRPDRAGRP